MAGTWIIMKHDLQTSPEVRRITRKTGAGSTFETVGRLHAVWSWADIHSDDGTMIAEPEDVDDIAGCDGFAAAMQDAGWLIIADGTIELPNFGDHNGQTGKRRAKEARRRGSTRKVSACDADKMRGESAEEVRKVSACDADKMRNTKQHKTTQDKTTPAAARSDLTPETHLQNAAVAAAVGVELSGLALWEALGKRAGLDRDTAGQCADAIDRNPPDSWEYAVVALERLSEAIVSQGVQTPVGLLLSILGESGRPSPARKTVARGRKDARERTDIINASKEWPDGYADAIYLAALDDLNSLARPAVDATPPNDWAEIPDHMLNYIARRYTVLADRVKSGKGAA